MENKNSVSKVRAGFEKMTHYGPGYTVVVRPDPANISHTHHRIFFHTDLTYYDYMPGVRSISWRLSCYSHVVRLCSCTALSSTRAREARPCSVTASTVQERRPHIKNNDIFI